MDRARAVTLAAAAVIAGWMLLAPPVLGLANNGDYGKVALRYGLFSPNEDEFHYAPQTHRFVAEKQWDSGIFTSTHVPVRAALALHAAIGGDTFDCRFLGVVYGLVFLLSIALVQPCLRNLGGWRRAVFNTALLLLLGDVAYLTLFNTFYMDATAYAGLLAAGAAWVRYRWDGQRRWLVLFVAAALLATLAKAQHLLLALPLALLAGRRSLAAALALAGGCAFGFRQVNPEYAPVTVFNTVFHSILPASETAEAHMAELGFDASWRAWIGTNAYSPGNRMGEPAFAAEVARRCSQFQVARFLAAHPVITGRILYARLADAAFIRPSNLGNYDRSAGREPGAMAEGFGLASRAKMALFLGRPLVLAGYILALLAGAAARRQWDTGMLAVTCGVAFAVGAFGDSLDVARHLTIFQALLDMLLLALLHGALSCHTLRTDAGQHL